MTTSPTAAKTVPNSHDYGVKDLGLAEWGRKEIAIAETEMPGLMATRAEFGPQQPLRGARIAGSLHMTIQTAVLIETLTALGADVRWASCNIYSTQDHAAAAIAAGGTPVFAIKGENLEDYWEYTHRIFEWADGGTPNMILDDGGDATLLVHLGLRAEKGDTAFLEKASNEEEEVLFAAIKKRLKDKPGWYTEVAKNIKGVTEETTTMEEAAVRADIFVTATGNIDVITIEHMRAMKDRAIVCNIGHFDSEIQVGALKNFKWHNVKPQVDEVEFADGKRIILLSEGRLVNLGNAMGHPSFVMSSSFTNQTIAQLELWTNPGKYDKKVYTLPKHLDEKVARLHLGKIGVKLTKLSDKQSSYIGVPAAGPFKPDHYRY